MSRRETIVTAVVTALQTITGLTVYREAVGATARAAGVVARVRLISDSAQPRQNKMQDHVLAISVAIVTQGATPEASADPYCVSVHDKLTTNQNIGGALSVGFDNATFAVEEADGGSVSVIQGVYLFHYRSDFASLN